MLTGKECKKWAYMCLMRPPMPGAIPKNGLDSVDFRDGCSLSGHHYWGHAVYTRELTKEEIDHYDLERTAFATLD